MKINIYGKYLKKQKSFSFVYLGGFGEDCDDGSRRFRYLRRNKLNSSWIIKKNEECFDFNSRNEYARLVYDTARPARPESRANKHERREDKRNLFARF